MIAIIALAGAGPMACGSQHAAPPNASGPSSARPTTSVSPSAAATATVAPSPTNTTCVGLSICAPPPPDADGNPACYYADGWRGDSSGAGIEVWYFHDPQSPSRSETITALVRKKDGTQESQDANVATGQQVHRFEFSTVAPSTVDEVLLSSGPSRCFVIGPQR